MVKQTYPRDRFDEIATDGDRVGAHRAENPRMRGWVVFLWAALATIVLIAVGIFATLAATGRISFGADESAAPPTVSTPTMTPILDTSYDVLVLNATPTTGLANQVAEQLVAAGFSADQVNAGNAASQDFATTTVYYAAAEDEAAAAGLADAIGGARVEQSDAYVAEAGATPQLTVVIGLDRAGAPPTTTG